MNDNMNKQGFTLLELSIVLVVIGLIVGGTVVGKDLIRASELNSIITQQNKIQIALNTFKLKYIKFLDIFIVALK